MKTSTLIPSGFELFFKTMKPNLSLAILTLFLFSLSYGQEVKITDHNLNFTTNFNGWNGTLPAGFSKTGTGATYVSNSETSTTGGTYDVLDSGFGYQASGGASNVTLTGTFKNSTGSTITSLEISYEAFNIYYRTSRVPAWTVTSSLGSVSDLNWTYNQSSSGTSPDLKTVILEGLNIPDNSTFTLSFYGDRGTGSGSTPKIGLNNISIKSIAVVNNCYTTNATNEFNDLADDGFGSWNLPTNTNQLGAFISTSTNNGDGDSNADGDIDTFGKAWGLYANSEQTANMSRDFDEVLGTGSTFSIQMDNGGDSGGTVGFGLQNSSGDNLIEFYFIGGGDFYQFNDSSGGINTSIPFTDEGLQLDFTLTSLSAVDIVVKVLENGTIHNFSKTLKDPVGGQLISKLRMFNANAGNGSPNNVYFNNLTYCPIPIVDADGDGYSADVDCDDNDAAINPGAVDVCDGIDNNCDGQIDENPAQVDYANLQFPYSATTICLGGSLTAYGQVFEDGLTTGQNGQADGISVQFGVSIENTDPATWAEESWNNATFNVETGPDFAPYNNDEYKYTFTPSATGTYYYTFRYSLNGCPYQYGGTNNGFWDGDTHLNGVLIVNEAPSITTSYSNITINTDSGVCGAVVDFDLPETTGTPSPTITYSQESGTLFPVGTTTVTIEATNSCGSDSVSFDVTVEDHEVPVVIVNSKTVYVDENGETSVSVSDIDGGSYDACGIASTTISENMFDCSDIDATPLTSDLFISEYIEGNGNNKCIEIYNGTGSEIDLSNYSLAFYFNGSTSAQTTLNLSGTIANGDVYVVCDDGATSQFLIEADFTPSDSFFNGDDAVVLSNSGTPIDIFGSIGEDPGSKWNVNGNETQDRTLVRKSTIISGNTNNLTGFPSLGTEWIELPQDDTTNLGSHSIDNGVAVTLTVTDVNGKSASRDVLVTVVDNISPTINCVDDATRNTDAGFCIYTVVGTEFDPTFDDNCDSTTISNDYNNSSSLAGATLPLGDTTITWTVDDGHGQTASCSTTITIDKIQTETSVSVSPSPQQYSDQVTFTATLTPGECSGYGTAAQTVTFFVDTQEMGTVALTLSNGVLTGQLTSVLLEDDDFGGSPVFNFNGVMAPGTHTVTAVFNSVDDDYLVSNATADLEITKEDALVEYTGQTLQATPSANDSQATVVLSATIQDIDDSYRGDIRNAQVKFVDRDSGNDLSGWIPVTNLIDPADTTTGTVSFDWEVDLGSQEYDSYTVGIIVDNGYYIRNNSDDNTVVTVYVPVGDFVTGGGYIIPDNSEGQYASTPGLKTNFGFNVKYNKRGNKLKGKMNVIFRRIESDGLHVYQIKSNSIQSLGVNTAATDDNGQEVAVATFITKSNLQDITNPLYPISLGGNLDLKVDMTDRGEPGNMDSIAFTLTDSDGVLLYSSEWNGLSTDEINLSGGNLVVQSGFSLDDTAARYDQSSALTSEFDILAFPNPFNDHINITVSSSNVEETTHIVIHDIYGKILFDEVVKVNTKLMFGNNLPSGMYIATIKLNNKSKTLRFIKN